MRALDDGGVCGRGGGGLRAGAASWFSGSAEPLLAPRTKRRIITKRPKQRRTEPVATVARDSKRRVSEWRPGPAPASARGDAKTVGTPDLAGADSHKETLNEG